MRLPMELLIKLEDLVNRALLWLGSKLVQLCLRVTPAPIRHFFANLRANVRAGVTFVRNLPTWLKAQLAALRARPKVQIDYKGLLAQAVDAGAKAFKKTKNTSPLKALGLALVAPLLFLGGWARTLRPGQFVLLTGFTTASLVALVGISLTARTILVREFFSGRAPASVEVDEYSRPSYYKQNHREVYFSSIKVPVYVEGINELRALMIDVSIITSNRATGMWLLREEFELRDHLVLTLEPVVPAFPLTPEGRQILTQKIQSEVNEFLRAHKINGHVQEVHLLHILAH